MADSSDAQQLIKKRARRRLVGAAAFAGLAAVVLPMVMDDEPKQQIQDVQIRIPGQNQTPFSPKALDARSGAAPGATPDAGKPAAAPVAPAPAPAKEKPVEKAIEKPAEKTADKPTEKPAEKPPAKAVEKPPEKPADKQAASEAQRAAAILGGKTDASPSGGQYVILIGAFANPANVKQLQSKIGELGVKTYTESLDSPQGKKTRVRAGPFPNREAADKALDRLKRIGVNGVVAARQ